MTEGNANIAVLLKRAFMFLEDGDWDSASTYCEKVLDLDPENAQAYLGKLMAELHVKKQEDLKDCANPFDKNSNFIKAVRFSDEALKTVLVGCTEHINTRNRERCLSEAYNLAKSKMSAAKTESDYKKVADIFATIHNYKDSEALIKVCQDKGEVARKEAEQRAEQTKKEAAQRAKQIKRIAIIAGSVIAVFILIIVGYTVLTNVFSPIPQYNDVEVGEYIKFGTYEQDHNTSNGEEDIEWLVLDVKEGKALIISKDAFITPKQYFPLDYHGTETWEACPIREWLNSDFINTAFSKKEQAIISTVTVPADDNPKYGTDAGNATQDKAFLLSVAEANKYFSSDKSRQCNNRSWWLRTPGFNAANTAIVESSGYIDIMGIGSSYHMSIRPAMWIDLNP